MCQQDVDECVLCFRRFAAEAWSRNQRHQSRYCWWDPRERHQCEFIYYSSYTHHFYVYHYAHCKGSQEPLNWGGSIRVILKVFQWFRLNCPVTSCVVWPLVCLCRRTSWWWSSEMWSRPTQRFASSSCRRPLTPPCSENTSSTAPSSRCSDAPSLSKVPLTHLTFCQ